MIGWWTDKRLVKANREKISKWEDLQLQGRRDDLLATITSAQKTLEMVDDELAKRGIVPELSPQATPSLK